MMSAHGLLRRPLLLIGLGLAAAVFLACLFGPLLASRDPLQPLEGGLGRYGEPQPASPRALLGTDSVGRDAASRLLAGGRNTLLIGFGGLFVSMSLAFGVGVGAGMAPGVIGLLLMRLTDVFMAFPAILLALCLAVILPRRDHLTLILIIGLLTWPVSARILRSEVLSLRTRTFVEAARIMGASEGAILRRHLLPLLLPTLVALTSLNLAATILLDAGLSFLGVGLPPPTPTWGGMLQEAQSWLAVAPWLAAAPGVAVVLTVGAFNLIAYDLAPSRRTGERR